MCIYYGLVLACCYVVAYILDMTPCELFLLAKNGTSKVSKIKPGKDQPINQVPKHWNILIILINGKTQVV